MSENKWKASEYKFAITALEYLSRQMKVRVTVSYMNNGTALKYDDVWKITVMDKIFTDKDYMIAVKNACNFMQTTYEANKKLLNQ